MVGNSFENILLDMLEEQEKLIGDLYLLFAEKYPDQQKFWRELSGDETRHAHWVRGLRGKVQRHTLLVNRAACKMEELQKFVKRIKKDLQDFAAIDKPAADAIKAALEIEHCLLEIPFSRVFIPTNGAPSEVIKNLDDQTRAHAAKIEEFYQKNRHSQSDSKLAPGVRASIRRNG